MFQGAEMLCWLAVSQQVLERGERARRMRYNFSKAMVDIEDANF